MSPIAASRTLSFGFSINFSAWIALQPGSSKFRTPASRGTTLAEFLSYQEGPMALSSRQHAYDYETEFFYRTVMQTLKTHEVPFLVGGAYAIGGHTGIVRETKDIDLFVKPSDCPRALEVLEAHGYLTELTDPIWLGKAFHGKSFADFPLGQWTRRSR
jgi:hypothetical protein